MNYHACYTSAKHCYGEGSPKMKPLKYDAILFDLTSILVDSASSTNEGYGSSIQITIDASHTISD
jgi:hypothetical protein